MLLCTRKTPQNFLLMKERWFKIIYSESLHYVVALFIMSFLLPWTIRCATVFQTETLGSRIMYFAVWRGQEKTTKGNAQLQESKHKDKAPSASNASKQKTGAGQGSSWWLVQAWSEETNQCSKYKHSLQTPKRLGYRIYVYVYIMFLSTQYDQSNMCSVPSCWINCFMHETDQASLRLSGMQALVRIWQELGASQTPSSLPPPSSQQDTDVCKNTGPPFMFSTPNVWDLHGRYFISCSWLVRKQWSHGHRIIQSNFAVYTAPSPVGQFLSLLFFVNFIAHIQDKSTVTDVLLKTTTQIHQKCPAVHLHFVRQKKPITANWQSVSQNNNISLQREPHLGHLTSLMSYSKGRQGKVSYCIDTDTGKLSSLGPRSVQQASINQWQCCWCSL